jgi:D-aspartate ligase
MSARNGGEAAPNASERPLPAVLLGGGIVAVSVARCLGMHGVRVWALGDARTDLVCHSRYCTAFVDLGSGDGVQDRWLEWLRSGELGEAVVLPCSDDALELVARERATLQQLGYRPIESNDEVILAMLDKLETYALARAAGVDVPRHFALDGVERLDTMLDEAGVGFPCALKPLHSHLFARHYGSNRKVIVAQDRAQLAEACSELAARNLSMMVTEIVPGPEDAYHSMHGYLDEHGELIAGLTKRKLRQNPVGFGIGCYHVTGWNEEVAEVALRFCRGAGILGMANPEFKRDERDGRLKLIECNHRFTMSNELNRHAGVNLPLVAYDRLVGVPVHGRGGFREGLHMWSPVEDAQAFLEARRRGQMTTRSWLASLRHRQVLSLYDRNDPGPGLESIRRRLRRKRRGRST